MKIFKYIFVLAVAAMATACGDYDPAVLVKDYTVSGKVLAVSSGSATIEINAPRPEGYTTSSYRAFEIYLKNITKGDVDVYTSDSRNDEIVGDRLITTITYQGLEPGCEYRVLYEGGTLAEAIDQYYFYDEASLLPLIELVTFTTQTMDSDNVLKASIYRSFVEDNGAILFLSFPYSFEITNYSYLYATKEDMSDAKEINMEYYNYSYGLVSGSTAGIALGGFLKPGTTYYFQLKGDYRVNLGGNKGTVSFSNATSTPVKFHTESKHTGLLGDAACSILSGYPSATMTDYASAEVSTNFYYPLVKLFDKPDYVTEISDYMKGKTYYPLCYFECNVRGMDRYTVKGVCIPTPNTITY